MYSPYSVLLPLSRNVLGVYLQLYEMGLYQISVFTPLLLHPLHPSPPLISCSHFMMTGNPAGLEGRHLSSHSQEGIFLSNMWRLWFKFTSKELWSFLRLLFLSQIKTMTVKSVNHQMYDNHFPQAHYCSAHGKRTRFIIMPLLLLQLWWFFTIPFTFSKVKHIHEATWTSFPCGFKTAHDSVPWQSIQVINIYN